LSQGNYHKKFNKESSTKFEFGEEILQRNYFFGNLEKKRPGDISRPYGIFE
jgi:hypothetical protein